MSATSTSLASQNPRTGVRGYDVEKVRRDFPILSTKNSLGKPLIYLDNGATTQKPRAVIDRIVHYYEHENANIHRGVYELSQNATRAYDETRDKIARFINARDPVECIFVRGTTEGINLVANSYGRLRFRAGDEILVGAQEHHSDIVPWQMTAGQTGAIVRAIQMNDAGELRLDELERMLSDKTKLVAVTHLSNALGTINDVRRISELAHRVGAKVLIDGAQWVAHFPTDVQAIDCDFYVFSGHKLFGPTGIGVLWGRKELLEEMPPYMGGGDMIESVTFEKTTYAALPSKFEAGTPDIAGVVGLGAAIDYVQALGFESFMPYEHELFEYATKRISEVLGLRIIGTSKNKASVISFVFENPSISPLDVGMALDREGICVRTGHHCCQPVMDRFKIAATTRVSLSLYNTRTEVDAVVDALKRIRGTASPALAGVSPVLEIKFPKASGRSPDAIADELVEMFDFLDDPTARNQQLLDFANDLPNYFEQLKPLTQRLPGCMSQVYLIARPAPDDRERLEFVADADAHIVRGEIAMLEKLFSGQLAKDILNFDVNRFFERVGLERFLSMQRRSGLGSMISRIQSSAKTIVEQTK
ncbi:MAG: SufS family cysteine desulfurase [Anaerolineae bacterium]|nr:SufS family cysteine desulfurase [Phycisphaerae bacterium]